MRTALRVALTLASTTPALACLDALRQRYGYFEPRPITTTFNKTIYAWAPNSEFPFVENGAVLSDGCIPCVGYPYNDGGLGLTTPSTLYFSKAGQLSAVSVDDFGLLTGEGYTNLEAMGVWLKVAGPLGTNRHRITIALRAGACSSVCDGTVFDEPVVTGKAMINPAEMVTSGPAINVPIPTTASEAVAAGWLEGACIDNMGTHYSYDVCGASSPYSAKHFTYGCMIPVTPMFATHNGCEETLMGWLFDQKGETTYWQGSTHHDPFSLPVEGVCFNHANMVDCALGKSGNIWSTMHIQLMDFPSSPYSCKASGKTDCHSHDLALGGLYAGCTSPDFAGVQGRTKTNGWSFYPGDGSRTDIVYDDVTHHAYVVPSPTPFLRFGPMPPWKGAPKLEECSTVKSAYKANQCCSEKTGIAYMPL